MTHPLFRKDLFVETAFEKRFQAMLRSAWHQRSWHVIVADPGGPSGCPCEAGGATASLASWGTCTSMGRSA
jgi:hypothetical protein